jgi:hypothetical protein
MFMSDSQFRKIRDVARDLGKPEDWVRMTRYYFRKGIEPGEEKLKDLSKVYWLN